MQICFSFVDRTIEVINYMYMNDADEPCLDSRKRANEGEVLIMRRRKKNRIAMAWTVFFILVLV